MYESVWLWFRPAEKTQGFIISSAVYLYLFQYLGLEVNFYVIFLSLSSKYQGSLGL